MGPQGCSEQVVRWVPEDASVSGLRGIRGPRWVGEGARDLRGHLKPARLLRRRSVSRSDLRNVPNAEACMHYAAMSCLPVLVLLQPLTASGQQPFAPAPLA